MAAEAPAVTREGAAMTREETIATIRHRIGIDLAWGEASDEDLAGMLAELSTADDRLADWQPTIERRTEVV